MIIKAYKKGEMSRRCPGKFLAEAEVALIALLLLSEYRAEISGAEGCHDDAKQTRRHGIASCESSEGRIALRHGYDGNCHGMHQEEQSGIQLSDTSGAESDTALPGVRGKSSRGSYAEAVARTGSAEPCDGHAASSAERGVSMKACHCSRNAELPCKACGQRQEQECHKGRVSLPVLPMPELRRQVGVRWPQHDLLIALKGLDC